MINILDENEDSLICEYIDKDSPYLKYKDSLVFERGNKIVYKEVGYRDGEYGTTLCCGEYSLPKDMPISYNYTGIGNIWLTSSDIRLGPVLREFPLKDEFLKYFKRRQVCITTYCAQKEYSYIYKPKRYLIIRDGGIDMLKSDIGRDIFTLEKR